MKNAEAVDWSLFLTIGRFCVSLGLQRHWYCLLFSKGDGFFGIRNCMSDNGWGKAFRTGFQSGEPAIAERNGYRQMKRLSPNETVVAFRTGYRRTKRLSPNETVVAERTGYRRMKRQ